jgi:hypothetical protein
LADVTLRQTSHILRAPLPADLVDHLAAGLIAWLVPEPGDLRGASPTWATLAQVAELRMFDLRMFMRASA